MKETWKDIPEYECRYQVSTHGRVRSTTRTVFYEKGFIRTFYGKILAPNISKNGYASYRLSTHSKAKFYTSHRLVIMAFVGNIGETLFIDHIDGCKTNNHLSNLRITTNQQNQGNRKLSSNNSSGYKGVHKTKNGKYRAMIKRNMVKNHIGVFNTAVEAAIAYDKAAIKHFGEYAKTNEMLGLLVQKTLHN